MISKYPKNINWKKRKRIKNIPRKRPQTPSYSPCQNRWINSPASEPSDYKFDETASEIGASIFDSVLGNTNFHIN